MDCRRRLPCVCGQRAGAGFCINVLRSSARCAVSAARIKKVVRHVLRAEKIISADLAFLFAGSAFVKRLNRRYAGREDVTDVLAFDMSCAPASFGIFGDVVVCVDVARSVSKELGVPFDEEVRRYLIHGVLHLIGYDDLTARQRRLMHRRQEGLVKSSALFGAIIR